MMGVRWDNRAAVERSMFIMRMMLSLFPLVLVVWNGEALPVQDKQSHTNEVNLLFKGKKNKWAHIVIVFPKIFVTGYE